MSDQTTPQPDDLGFQLPPPAKGSRIGVIIVLAVIVGGGFLFGYMRYRNAHGETAPGVEAGKATRVELVKPKVLASDFALTLPGTVKPLEEAKVYARVSGYVKAWKVDLGDKVTAGQLLAEIDTPELLSGLSQARAELAAARANVKQATAQRDYSKANSERYVGLAGQNLISKGQVDEQVAKAKTDEATVTAAESNVAALEANVRRLTEMQTFSKVVAPFAGTVTQRAIDRGQLVRDGGTTPLYTIVATDPVRIFIDVPQSIAAGIRPDTAASVSVREYGDRVFAGKVTRTAGALDAEMHTMMTEIQIPNSDGALLPGMYVQARLESKTPHRVLEIPSTAIYNDANGLRVAIVDAGKRIKFAKITVERDTGAALHVASGLTGDEQIVKIAMPTLLDGDVVEVVK
jgi:membrane fusion protein, multidrug efflux system